MKPLSKLELECCWLTWGGIPLTKELKHDLQFIRDTLIFKLKLETL